MSDDDDDGAALGDASRLDAMVEPNLPTVVGVAAPTATTTAEAFSVVAVDTSDHDDYNCGRGEDSDLRAVVVVGPAVQDVGGRLRRRVEALPGQEGAHVRAEVSGRSILGRSRPD